MSDLAQARPSQLPTAIPPAAPEAELYASLAHVDRLASDYVATLEPVAANDAEPSLEEMLDASLAILAAAERVELLTSDAVLSADCIPAGAVCECGADCSERGEAYRVTTAIPMRAVMQCSVECAALHLLAELHPTQDQRPEKVRVVEYMIERSFAADRNRAALSAARVMVPAAPAQERA